MRLVDPRGGKASILYPADLGIRLKTHPGEIVLEFPRKTMAAIVEIK